jgi:hypothetical protein
MKRSQKRSNTYQARAVNRQELCGTEFFSVPLDPLRESGRRLEDCRTPKAGAIADTMPVRERVTGPRRLRRFTAGQFPGCDSSLKSIRNHETDEMTRKTACSLHQHRSGPFRCRAFVCFAYFVVYQLWSSAGLTRRRQYRRVVVVRCPLEKSLRGQAPPGGPLDKADPPSASAQPRRSQRRREVVKATGRSPAAARQSL